MTYVPDNILKCMSKEDRKPLGKAGFTHAEIKEIQARKLERQVQAEVLALLRIRGIEVLTPTFGKKTTIKKGWPDCTFSYKGRPIVWEIKAEGGKCSKEQAALHDKLRANGWVVEVISDVIIAREVLNAYDIIDQLNKSYSSDQA